MKITLDGVELEVPDAAGAAIQRLTGERDARIGELAVLAQKLKDAEMELAPDKIDARVAARMDVVGKTRAALGDGYQTDGRSDADLRRAVVASTLGEPVARAMNDAAIDGAFAALTHRQTNNGAQRLSDYSYQRQNTQDARDDAERAWEERGRLQRNAWKGQAQTA